MCGRFSLKKSADEIQNELGVDDFPEREEWLPGYNLAPTLRTPVLVAHSTQRELRLMRWGLIPFWAKDATIGNRLINARCETLTEKPSFRHLVGSRRCSVVAHGYFEWRREAGTKTPHFIYLPGQPLMLMAGLWDVWEQADGQILHSYTIITTSPAEPVAHLHDRMPVILSRESADTWLDDTTTEEQAVDLLAPYSGELHYHPVSSIVNNVRHDEPACIEPPPEDPQGTLF